MSDVTPSAAGKNEEVSGNPRVLWISFVAFSLGFAIWGMFSALGPFLIKWYGFSPDQALLLAAMPPLFATIVCIPLGIAADRFGGRRVFTITLLAIALALVAGVFSDTYFAFLVVGLLLGLGGATFVIGNAHVSAWYPKSRQGTALGIFALGNFGISLSMISVPWLVVNVLGGPVGYAELPPKISFLMIDGWHLIFLIAAVPVLIMAACYWFFTSDPKVTRVTMSVKEIVGVYKSGTLVWIVAYLYWCSFGTLTFFSAMMPTYLVDRWDVDASNATMIFTSLLVVFVAITRPVGGWFSDRRDPLKMLVVLFGVTVAFAVVLMMEISLPVQIVAIYAMAMLSGASAATVVKLIATHFRQVGTVSGLAKAAGAACGFSMTIIMALSKNYMDSYTPGFGVWVGLNILALYLVVARTGFPKTGEEGVRTAVPVRPALQAME